MSFPRYESYKDSGVEWLGEVPAHWWISRLRFITECLDGKRIPLNSEQRADKQGNIPYWGANSIVDWVDEALFDEVLVLLGEDGAPFFDRSKPVSFLSEGKVWPNNHVHVLRPPSLEAGKFITYCLNITDFANFIDGSTRDKLTQSQMNNIPIPWAPLSEQQNIASFLDRETAKIDTLIAEQQRLIELLKEKRQAVISHAVTKGLNPDAPMKDSGIEWLGEVPAHWEIMPLKRDLTFLTSGSRGWADHYSDEGALFIRIGNLMRNSIRIDLSDIQRVSVPDGIEGERTKIQHGDVLFSITAYLGSVAVVTENLEAAYVSQHVALARLRQQRLLPDWVAYVTLSIVGKTYLETQGYGGTKIQLSLDDVANLVMTVPDLKEQAIITNFLNREIATLDDLTAEAQRTVCLLQERRTAVISAAVTGKIDIRTQL